MQTIAKSKLKKLTDRYEASGNKQAATRIKLSACIATDDPRLAK
jgi:hypothetical protein